MVVQLDSFPIAAYHKKRNHSLHCQKGPACLAVYVMAKNGSVDYVPTVN